MHRKISDLLKRLKNRVARRSFLVRMLSTTLIASLIPLTIMSVHQINRENTHVRHTVETQLQITTVMASQQFDLYVSDMKMIAGKLAFSGKFYESRLSESINAELDALDKLQSYSGILPYVHFYAIYNLNSGIAYTNRGKMQGSTLMKYELNLTPAEFDAILLKYSKTSGFYARDDGRSSLFFVPMRNNSSVYFIIYLINAADISNSLTRGALGEYSVLSIRDANGMEILKNTIPMQPDNYCFFTYVSSKGIALEMALKSTDLQNSMTAITANSRQISAINVILSVFLIIFISALNYRPFATLLRHVTGENAGREKSEINSLLETYNSLIEDKKQLTIELYEKEQLVMDVAFEKALNGSSRLSEILTGLPAEKSCQIIACCNIVDVESTESILQKNVSSTGIHAIEMYPEKLLVFICSLDNDHEETLAQLRSVLTEDMSHGVIPFGFSSVFSSWNDLHKAYLEARSNLNTESAKALQLEKSSPSEAALISFIQSRYTDSLFCLEDIADYLDVSVYTASRIFKTCVGQSLRKYLNDLRIEYACRLLSDGDLSINDIAIKSGFTSASYFNRIFKDSKGVTPTVYRRLENHPNSQKTNRTEGE